MANPGYPMQPPMMGGPPQGMRPSMPPQQMQQPQLPARRGTPKAVPIMVSAGLAVGVFCGLLFGVGTGENEAKADAPKDKQFVGTKIDGTDETATATGPTGPTPPKTVTDGTLATGTMKQPKPAAGSATGSAGSAAGSAATTPTVPAVPEIKMAKLVIAIKPDTVKDAKITVDGVDVTNNKLELALGDKTKKEVTVVVKAPGYRDLEQKLEVNEGETNVEYQLVKKSTGGSSTPKRPPPPGGSGKKKKGGGGLIDI